MEKTLKNKIIASILIFILTLANAQGLITGGIAVFASSIENQNQETNHKNVDFNAQFMVINNEKKYSIKENISNDEIYINIFTEIKEAGYLKSGSIIIKDEEGKKANFNLSEIEQPDAIQNIDYNKNEIILNQINNGEKLDINIPIKAITSDVFDLNDFSKNSIITFSGIYVDGKGEEKEVEKEIKLKAEWKEEAEAIITQDIINVLPYELEEEKGIVISEKIKVGIRDGKLPVKLASINVQVPKIEDILPTEVRVENVNTSLNVTSEYKDGILNIILENKISENNTIIWSKVLEELEVTYIYNLENNETENVEEIISEVETSITGKLEAYSGEIKTLDVESKNTIDISKKVGNSIDENTISENGIIYKGNMLFATGETEFKVTSNIDVSYEKLVEQVEVKYNKDKYLLNEQELEANTYYKKIMISKDNFDKILGEEGEIKIYSSDNLLGTINNNNNPDEEGNIVFNFENDLASDIKIVTTKPIYSGILKLDFVKAIRVEENLSKEDIKNISHIKLESLIDENKNEAKIKMQNSETKVDLETNTNILSTVVENKGVEFAVTLNNKDLSCDLFENPKIEIRLPEAVTNVIINNIELLLEDELVIENYEYVKETNSIIIALKGVQTKYNLSEVAHGATIIVNTDITVDKLAVNKKDKVVLLVVNDGVTSYKNDLEGKGYNYKDINIVAPLGLIALNSAEGYNDENDETTSIGRNEVVGKIEPNAETKIATMKITAINNYDSIINNIRILGRIPFEGNKSLVDGTDLGTTFNAVLKGEIVSEVIPLENIVVYYSENGDATEDLSNPQNGWLKEVEEFSKVKSYLIVLKDYEMTSGQKAEFKYEIEVPEGLELGSSAHGTYIVYYDNKKDDVVYENTSVPAVIGLTTGEAPKIEMTINSDMPEGKVIRSGQVVRYSIKVKNIGSVDASQVYITTDIPDGVTYAELVLGGNYSEDYYNLNTEKKSFNKLIGDLKVGEEKTVEYLVRVNEDLDKQKEIKTKVKLSAKNLPEMIESNELKNLIDTGSMLIETKSDKKEDEKIKVGDTIVYTTKVTNISNYDINKVVAKIELPGGVTYKNAYIEGTEEKANYNESLNIVEWNIDEIKRDEYVQVVLEVVANDKKDNVEMSLKAIAENVVEHESNICKIDICTPSISVKQESTIPEGYISIGDKIEYKIQVTNSGNLDATNIEIIDFVPEGMRYLETSYEINGINKTVKSSSGNEAKLELNVPANQTLNMSVKVKADGNDKEVKATNIVKVINDGIETYANDVTHIIEAETLGNMQNSTNGTNSTNNIELVNTYKISGTAWFDSDEDGLKDNEEAVLAGITVMLLDKKTGEIAKDANGQELNTTTEGNGTYTFRNLNQGEYIVIFVYDTSKYVITEYKKAQVEESKNSDVANMKVTINGEEKSVAVSDIINISEENIYNINIGLKGMPKFDLKLDKQVNKITVKNNDGAKVYSYDNTKLAKIELDSKTASNSTLIIEYKLIITNEGSVAGYAKRVVDYIPRELKFSSELNSSWYLAEDGNVYTSELTNVIINPGESKELTLVLTKQIIGENIGLINNNAEIEESYNDYGTQDEDSTSGNKQASEDDMSNADIYIGIKTGSPVTYIGLSIIIMMVLAAGAYLINTKVLIKK